MASELTPLIGLFKAIPGTNEPFRAADINDNWDILDTFIVNYEDRFTELETEADAAVAAADAATAASTAALDQFEIDSVAAIDQIETDADAALAAANAASDAALTQFEDDYAAAIATLDTEAIIEAIDTMALDINGGTA